MIARNVDDPRSAPRPLEDTAHHIIMLAGPVELLLEPPAVDDVADQIEHFAVGVVEEIDQLMGIAAFGSQMDIADPDRAKPASGIHRSDGHTSELKSLMRTS